MIEFDRVTKKYGSIPALREVSFRIQERQTVGLLGRNGAGKTTALNLMTGYFPPTSGTVRIHGMDMQREARKCKRMIGFLPERPPLYDEMTVQEYLRFVCELREVVPRRIAGHVDEIIALCSLGEMRNRLLGHLSLGYRQRAGIAQALCGSPEVLIFDEPTTGLDPKQTVEIRELIRSLGKEHTVVFSSHILSEVQQLCSRVIILQEGRTVLDMDRDEKQGSTANLVLTAAGDEGRILAALRELPVVRKAEGHGGSDGTEVRLQVIRQDENGRAEDQIFRVMARLNAPIRQLREEQDTLEEVFLKVCQ